MLPVFGWGIFGYVLGRNSRLTEAEKIAAVERRNERKARRAVRSESQIIVTRVVVFLAAVAVLYTLVRR